MRVGGYNFPNVWVVDFRYKARPGNHPEPVCMVALEMGTGTLHRLAGESMRQHRLPPYGTGDDTLIVSFYPAAEMQCHLALNWPLPYYLLDLYGEVRCLTNGVIDPSSDDFAAALGRLGVQDPKTSLDWIKSGASEVTGRDEDALAECERGVRSLAKMLEAMAPYIDISRAMVRGRYAKAAAQIEWQGVPLDTHMLGLLIEHGADIKHKLIAPIDARYGVYSGGAFSKVLFGRWLYRQGIRWPKLATGKLDLQDDTFRDMADAFPVLGPLHQLRMTLSKLQLGRLAVGDDGRNRCPLMILKSKTGRNQPSGSAFIFNLPRWVRALIRPRPGYGLAYLDWEQQEFGIAAALSADKNMMAAYLSGDPYSTFAVQAGADPALPGVRKRFKTCAIGVQYGMGMEALACRIGGTNQDASQLLKLHRSTYPEFWAWSDRVVDYGFLHGQLFTALGWSYQLPPDAGHRTLRNLLLQANGAELLRLACTLVTEAGIGVCAPVHDAILIEAPLHELEAIAAKAQGIMEEASAVVLGGFRLRSKAEYIRYPDRYWPDDDRAMWGLVCGLIPGREVGAVA